MLDKKTKDRIGRAMASIACVLILATGVAATLRTWPFYSNYWGGIIYGPIAIAISLLGLYILIFKYEQAERIHKETTEKGYKSPLDDIKW